MKIALVQFSPIWEDKKKNIHQIINLVSNLDSKTDLLIFPEMTLTGFTMNSKQNAEEIDGIGVKFFIEQARKLKTNIIAGIIEKENSNFLNSLFHFDKNGLITAVYKKIHPFSLAEEDLNFSSGSEIVTTSINNHKFGLSICYDLRFPELYRLNVKNGAEIFINIANWPVKRIEHWKQLLKARAIENLAYFVGVNRIGNDPYQTYNGCSAVFDPMGNELIINQNEEKIIYADIYFEKVNEVRNKLGFLNDIKLI
jgi:predicted amidohydrolase